MTILDALTGSSALRPLVCAGLGALRKADKKKVRPTSGSSVRDSLDLDAASRDEHPEDHRWDYILAWSRPDVLVGVEPHSARDSEVSVVIAKKRSAMTYLRAHLRTGRAIDRWIWVSTGVVGFSRMDPARRRLDQSGIAFVSRVVERV